MRITETKTYLKDGIEYLEKTYSNGTVVNEAVNNEEKEIKIPTEPEPDPVMEKLDSIEAKIQINEDLQTFYDDIVKEVGL